jgi:hypothetical protein
VTVPEEKIVQLLVELRSVLVGEVRSMLDVGLAKIDGRLVLLVHRDDQADKAIEDLSKRVTALEKMRWPLPTVTVLASIAAVALTLYGVLSR